MFQNEQYLTNGVHEFICITLQMVMWQMIEEARKSTKLDYLQVFKLSKSPSGLIHIIHEQEQPEYKKEVDVLCDSDIDELITVFVIDDGDHSTMLLAEEY